MKPITLQLAPLGKHVFLSDVLDVPDSNTKLCYICIFPHFSKLNVGLNLGENLNSVRRSIRHQVKRIYNDSDRGQSAEESECLVLFLSSVNYTEECSKEQEVVRKD